MFSVRLVRSVSLSVVSADNDNVESSGVYGDRANGIVVQCLGSVGLDLAVWQGTLPIDPTEPLDHCLASPFPLVDVRGVGDCCNDNGYFVGDNELYRIQNEGVRTMLPSF